MNFNQYQFSAMRTKNPDADLVLNAALGLSGEAGEVADIIKKHYFQGHPFNKEKLIDECGDVLWYITLMADALGITLEDIAVHNIEKLEKRYPDKQFKTEHSLNRKD